MISFKGERISNGFKETSNNKYSLCVYIHDHNSPQNPTFLIKINPFEKPITTSSSSSPPRLILDYHYQCGSAAVDSILYLFGGFNSNRETFKCTNSVSFIDTSNSTTMDDVALKPYCNKMFSARFNPCVLTIHKKIYIFGTKTSMNKYSNVPLDVWAEVLDTETKSFSGLRDPPTDCRRLLKEHNISASAIIKNGEKIIFAFSPCNLLLLYNVEKNTWFKFYVQDCYYLPLAKIGNYQRFLSRCPVINNVMYSYTYDPERGGNVYGFDLHKYQWFTVKFLTLQKKKCYIFSSWKEVKSLSHFKTKNYGPTYWGGIHDLGNGLLCVVFDEELGYNKANHLHCVVFRPVVGGGNSTDKKLSIQAKVERTACYEIGNGEYLDSVLALCVEEKVDESMWIGKHMQKVVMVLDGAILLRYGFYKMVR